MYNRSWRNLNQPQEPTGIKSWPILKLFFKKNKRRLILRDYQPKTFVNPFYSQVSRPRRAKAIKIKLAILVLAMAGNLGVLLKHPFFNISQINLSGGQKITLAQLQPLLDRELAQTKFLFLGNRNYWLIDTERLAETIEENYSLEKLKVAAKFPRTLKIILKEKEAALVYKTETGSWLLDNQGRVIQEFTNSDSAALPVAYGADSASAPKINTGAVPAATIKFLTYLQTKLPEIAKVEADYSRLIDEEGRVVHLKTKENWEIYLDRQNDWDKQLGVLATILSTKLKNGRDKIKYLDVRYENRAYFQ